MPRLTDAQRWEAVGMRRAEMDRRLVAAHFRVDTATISLWMSRVHQTGHVHDRMRTGRRRVTTAQQDRDIQLSHLRSIFHPASAAAQIGLHGQLISEDSTSMRCLRGDHSAVQFRPKFMRYLLDL